MWWLFGVLFFSILLMASEYEKRLEMLRGALEETADRVKTLEIALKKVCLEAGITEPPLGSTGELLSKMVESSDRLKRMSEELQRKK